MLDLNDDDNLNGAQQEWPPTEEQIIRKKKVGFWIGSIVTVLACLGLVMLVPPLAGWPAITAIEYAVGGFFIAYLGGLLGRKLSTNCCMGKDTGDSGSHSLNGMQDFEEESESQKTKRNIFFTIGFLAFGGLASGLGFAFVLPLFTPSYLVWGAYVLGCGFLAFCGGKGAVNAMDNSTLRRDDSALTPPPHVLGGSTSSARLAMGNNPSPAWSAPLSDDVPPLDREVVDDDRAFAAAPTFSPREEGDELHKRLTL